MENKKINCTVKKVVIEYFVAQTDDGEEFQIKGISEDDLIDGMELSGILLEDYTQIIYGDGTHSREYTKNTWIQVD